MKYGLAAGLILRSMYGIAGGQQVILSGTLLSLQISEFEIDIFTLNLNLGALYPVKHTKLETRGLSKTFYTAIT